MDSNLNNKNMNSIKTLAICAVSIFSIILAGTLLMSFKTPPPPPPSNIYIVTSYDGMTLYSYGDYVIVKTDNSISISK